MEGMGIYIWNDGRKYEGQYKDDKISFPDGNVWSKL